MNSSAALSTVRVLCAHHLHILSGLFIPLPQGNPRRINRHPCARPQHPPTTGLLLSPLLWACLLWAACDSRLTPRGLRAWLLWPRETCAGSSKPLPTPSWLALSTWLSGTAAAARCPCPLWSPEDHLQPPSSTWVQAGGPRLSEAPDPRREGALRVHGSSCAAGPQ